MIPREVYEQTTRKFLAPVAPFLDDPAVTEIMINGPDEVMIERGGTLHETSARFACADDLEAAIRHLAQFAGRSVGRSSPILEGRLPDGSRVEAVLPPAAPDGPHVAIRRFPRDALTIETLIACSALTASAAELLRALVRCRQNIVIAGGTGSGKTSLLGALSAFVPRGERILVIEDARELQLQQRHVVQLEAQPPNARGEGAVSIRQLFRASLRMRPDRIVVGEIRGGESLDLIQAMTSGHGGCLSTVHATYPRDTLSRLETLALMSDVEMPLAALQRQIASAIHIVVQTSRLPGGGRGVTHISEVRGRCERGGYELTDLFVRDASGLVATGERPGCQPMIDALAGRESDR